MATRKTPTPKSKKVVTAKAESAPARSGSSEKGAKKLAIGASATRNAASNNTKTSGATGNISTKTGGHSTPQDNASHVGHSTAYDVLRPFREVGGPAALASSFAVLLIADWLPDTTPALQAALAQYRTNITRTLDRRRLDKIGKPVGDTASFTRSIQADISIEEPSLRAQIVENRIAAWIRELRQSDINPDRLDEITKSINSLYNSHYRTVKDAEGDNILRCEIAEQIRIVGSYRVPEVLQQFLDSHTAPAALQKPSETPQVCAERFHEYLGCWLNPIDLILSLVRVRHPSVISALSSAASRPIIQEVLNEWQKPDEAKTSVSINPLLESLFREIGKPYAASSFASKFRDFHSDRPADEVRLRRAFWRRLAVVLDEFGFASGVEAIVNALERHWESVVPRSHPHRTTPFLP